MDKLVISIVTWNSASSIENCIKSILEQSYSGFKLIIVDNASKDETANVIKSFRDDRIEFVQKQDNTGFCGGHNYSIANSDSEYVLLVNPDIIMSTDYVERALAVIRSENKIGTVCGLLLQSDASDQNCLIDSAGIEMKRSGIMKMRFNGERLSDVELSRVVVFGADGALPLYSRDMINDISYQGRFFDEMFFAHKEDWDVSWRSNIYGWKTIFCSNCVAVHPRHFKPGSLKLRSEISGSIKFHSVKNQLILILKNESLSSFLKNIFYVIPRQFTILIYILLFERTSLEAYRFIFINFRAIIKQRRVIQSKLKSQK